MKRSIALILLAAILLLLSACEKKAPKDDALHFYYPRNQVTYGTQDGLISSESAEINTADTLTVLQTYLNGPSDLTLKNPFPHNTTVLSAKQKDTLITLVLSDEFSALSGIDLTVACACLARTTFELTGCSSVTITCQSQMIDGEQSLTFFKEGVLLLDESKGTVPASPISTLPSE